MSASKVRVLTSVTRITIGHDTKMTVEGQGRETPARGASASVSRSKAMSFRSVQRKESILKKRRIQEEEEEEDMGEDRKQVRRDLQFHGLIYVFSHYLP